MTSSSRVPFRRVQPCMILAALATASDADGHRVQRDLERQSYTGEIVVDEGWVEEETGRLR